MAKQESWLILWGWRLTVVCKMIPRPRIGHWGPILRCAAIVLVCISPEWSATLTDKYYVFTRSSHLVSVVQSNDLEVVGAVDLGSDFDPSNAILGPEGRSLYVLNNGLLSVARDLDLDLEPSTAASELFVLDTDSDEVIKRIPLGWNENTMLLSKDSRYLVCFSEGSLEARDVAARRARVTVIDTRTNDVAAAFSPSHAGIQFLFTDDLSRIFVLSKTDPRRNRNQGVIPKPALTVFGLGQEGPLAVLEFQNTPSEMALSRDQRWLYVLDKGNLPRIGRKRQNGAVHVINAATAELIATHDVGPGPRGLVVDPKLEAVTVLAQDSWGLKHHGKLYQFVGSEMTQEADIRGSPRGVIRLGQPPVHYVVTSDALGLLPDQGPLESSYVDLKPKEHKGWSGFWYFRLRAFPDEIRFLPKSKKLAMTASICASGQRYQLRCYWGRTGGVPIGAVVLVDLKRRKLAHFVDTGPRGFASDSEFSFFPAYRSLAVSQDERFIYALNGPSGKVTIMDAEDGSVLGKINIGRGGKQIFLTPGGRFVFAEASHQITLIDTETNEIHLVRKFPKQDNVVGVYVDDQEERLIVFADRTWLVFDARQGKLAKTVSGVFGGLIVKLSRAQRD